MKNSWLGSISHALAAVVVAVAALSVAAPGPVWAGDDEHHKDEHHKKDEHKGDGGGQQGKLNILMNYELGMHCTGFEFAYCCVLPVYNSILAQVVKTQADDKSFPTLLEGDPNLGKDLLDRQTVLRDPTLDNNGNFRKYILKYWHDAQPRNDGRGKPQTSTLISNAELNSLLAWNTVADSAALNPDGSLKTGTYNGATNVLMGDGDLTDATDNYQNAIWNHLYIYADPDHLTPAGPNLEGHGATGIEADKIRLGIAGMVEYPVNTGPALHPLGPVGSGSPFDNVLTYSGETGTIVYTQMKVLEDLPITLTSPRIWEALGLPLTPFEDSIDFFTDPGLVDEDSIRPYVQMKAQVFEANCDNAGNCTPGNAVLDNSGNPVIGFGTAPIDIPNCERCHAAPPVGADGNPNVNSPNTDPLRYALVQQEINFWNAYYDIDTTAGDSDWYARLKGAAISMLSLHDEEHGTSFTANYPGVTCVNGLGDCAGGPLSAPGLPQNTRLGHESVMCQRCHADNVIAVVKSANCGPDNIGCEEGDLIPPLTEAIHYNHREVSEGGPIVFTDSLGRSGGCQGCHPAHRSDGNLAGYPITLDGDNFYAASDNRDAAGGCFVGRDVHSNPLKDVDGAETPSHLNPVGQWLLTNVANDTGSWKGIWCTNCHSQLGQELWKAENVPDLVHAQPGDPGHVREPAPNATLTDVAAALGFSEQQVIDWLDPKDPALDPNRTSDQTHAVWAPDPGLCDHVATLFGAPANPAQDANVATIEVDLGSGCSTGFSVPGPDCDANGSPDFQICGSLDADGDFSVSLAAGGIDNSSGTPQSCDPANGDPNCEAQSPFCTTPDCVDAANFVLANSGGGAAVPVPFSAATDGRDHWLAPGEPHCADCHAAPYVEQSGNINAFPPFNYPRKASLMRYSRGHQDITCQGCHESIHGLYPVGASVDTTSYAQAASLNADGSHGPLKCAACHLTNGEGVHKRVDKLTYRGTRVKDDFDAAVGWAHTFTLEHDPTQDWCLNCHEDETDEVAQDEEEWLEHAMKGRVSRNLMDRVEVALIGHVSGDPDAGQDPLNTVCQGCHGDKSDEVSCGEKEWKEHLTEGRVAHKVWEYVSVSLAGSTCGW